KPLFGAYPSAGWRAWFGYPDGHLLACFRIEFRGCRALSSLCRQIPVLRLLWGRPVFCFVRLPHHGHFDRLFGRPKLFPQVLRPAYSSHLSAVLRGPDSAVCVDSAIAAPLGQYGLAACLLPAEPATNDDCNLLARR